MNDPYQSMTRKSQVGKRNSQYRVGFMSIPSSIPVRFYTLPQNLDSHLLQCVLFITLPWTETVSEERARNLRCHMVKFLVKT